MNLSPVRLAMFVASIAPALPVVVGGRRFPHLRMGGKMLVGWLLVSLVLGVIMMSMGMRGIKNSTFSHLSLPGFCVLGLVALGMLAENQRYQRAVRVAAVFFVVVWVLVTARLGIASDYSIYAHPLMNLIFTIAAAGLVVVRLHQIESRPLRDPVILIALGTLVSYAPSVAINPVLAIIAASNRELASILIGVRAGFFIVGALLYTLALLWIRPHPSSSGS